MKLLVTGGAGYVGSHTCKALKLAGHTPVTVDNLVYGHKWAVKWGPFHEMDVRDTEKLTKLMVGEKIEAVIHFAGSTHVGESVTNPLKYYDNNFAGSLSLFEAMNAAKVDRLVFSSTCAVYGSPDKIPITEDSRMMPVSPYGGSKLMVEKVLQDLAAAKQMKSVALRYFNAAGGDAELETGEDHTPETHLIPLAIAAALRPDAQLTLYGNDYPTKDGTCIRDYIHVTDLADAHVRALDHLSRGKVFFEAFNLGTGKGHSVKEIIEGIERISGRKVKVKPGDRRHGDPAELVADASRAGKVLGWTPRHSSLDEILRTAIQWFEKHHLRFQ